MSSVPSGFIAGPAWSAGRRGRTCWSTASRSCCCAPTTTSASRTIRACVRRLRARRCAGESAPAASRLVSGTMTIHRRLEERLAAFTGRESALLFGSGYLAGAGVDPGAGASRRRDLLRCAQPRLGCRRLPAVGRRGVRVRARRCRAPPLGDHPGRGPRCPDRHRQRVLDRWRRRAAGGDRRPGARPRSAHHDRRGARNRRARAGRTRRAGRGGARGSGRRDRRHARHVAGLLRRVRGLRSPDVALPDQRRADVRVLHRAGRRRPWRAPWRRSTCSWNARGRSRSWPANATALRTALEHEGFDLRGSRTQIVPLRIGDADRTHARLRSGAGAGRVRPVDPTAGGGADDLVGCG